MNKLTLSLVLIFMTLAGFSQTLTIVDSESKEPIPFAVLMCKNTSKYASTNQHGQIDISSFSKESKLVVSVMGYKKTEVSISELAYTNYKLELSPSNFNLGEVVVSGTRWQQNSGDVPAKIISISAKEVQLQNPQTSADLLGLSGKVFIQKSQQGGGSPMIRGFATNRLLYTVDGVRMNTAIFRGGNIQNVISLDPFATEKTEVLFGPGSVIYGSDAIGGVMSFQTITPQLSCEENLLVTGKASARFSTANNEMSGHADVGVGGKKWAFVSSFSYWDFDNLQQGSKGPDDYIKSYHVERINNVDTIIRQTGKDSLLQIPTAYKQFNTMQKVRFAPNSHWDIQYGFHYSETSPYGRYDRHNRVSKGQPKYAVWDYGPQLWMMNNVNITNSVPNGVYDQMTLRLAQQKFEESRIDRNFQNNNEETKTEKVDAYSINFDFVKKVSSSTLFYGAEYVLNKVESTGEAKDIVSGVKHKVVARYPQSDWKSMALYLNHEIEVGEKLIIQDGLRYSLFGINSSFDTTLFPYPVTKSNFNKGALTGNLGFVYKPMESWIISLNLGTAYRAPNVDDIGKVFDSGDKMVVVPNTNLDAEYAYNIDFSMAKTFYDVIKLDATVFYTHLDNALVRRDFQFNGQDSIVFQGDMSRVQAIQNAAKAYVYGVQTGAEIKLPIGLGISSDFNYQKGEEQLDDLSWNPLRHSAPWFGTSRVNYSFAKTKLTVYANYQGSKSFKDLAAEEQAKTEIYALDKDGKPYSPSWWTLNVKAQYEFSGKLMLTAGVENILDKRYRPYSSGISSAGRNYFASLQARF